MRTASKKLISVVLAIAMLLSAGVFAFAAGCDFDYDLLDDDTGSIYAFNGVIKNGVFTIVDVDEEWDFPLSAVAPSAFAYQSGSPAFLENVTTLIVEEGICDIGARAFAKLPALRSIVFNGDVTVGEAAFIDCKQLTEVTFKGAADLKKDAFAGCTALEKIDIPEDKDFSVGGGALNDTLWFKNYDVDFVTVGTTLIAYKGSQAEEKIPLNITAIGSSAFAGNKSLKKITISRYVETIGEKAFADSGVEEVEYDNFSALTDVASDAFLNTPYYDNYPGDFFIIGTKLIKYKGSDVSIVRIPNTVTEIAAKAFDGCYKFSGTDGSTFVPSAIIVPMGADTFGDDCFALSTFADSNYSPRIYAYSNTPGMEALTAAGYVVTPIPRIGDVDNTGAVEPSDARQILRYALGLDDYDDIMRIAADIDGNGMVEPADSRLALRLALDLEDYTAEDLMNAPRTADEILAAYTAALKKAAEQQVGYTKTVTSAITAQDIDKVHEKDVLDIAKKNMVNTKKSYASDTQSAVDNLFIPTLLSTGSIKSVSNELVGGKYYITVKFNDVTDAYLTYDTPDYTAAAPDFGKAMPFVNGQVFYNALASQKWFNLIPADEKVGIKNGNCIRKYSLSFAEPTVVIVINASNNKVESIKQTITYKFAIDGYTLVGLVPIGISSKMWKTGDATVERTDTVSYTNFLWK